MDENDTDFERLRAATFHTGEIDTGAIHRHSADIDRDALWSSALIQALGEGVIDTYQMEGILRIFNASRPDKEHGHSST
jgi:hypothetical protein